MSIYPAVPELIVDLIKNCSKAVVVGHRIPDGDCVYSCLAMASILKSLGKSCELLNEGPFNKSEVIPQAPKFKSAPSPEFLASKPLVIVLDCGDFKRIGTALTEGQCQGLQMVVLDHHSSSDESFGTAVYRVSESISTTLLVLRLAEALGVKIDKECAEFIYRGFITDSGCFKFLDSSQNESFGIIAGLVTEFSLCTNYEYEYLYSRQSMDSNRYLAELIARSQLFFDGRLVVSFEKQGDEEQFNHTAAPSDEFYARMLAVSGVQVTVLLKYINAGRTNLGFRSTHRSGIDVGQTASSMPDKFNGGGHAHAAGAEVPYGMDKTLEILKETLAPVLSAK